MSELLALQRENRLVGNDSVELSHLMHVYQEGLVQKALATQEAVRSGIWEPFR
jgi:hypothetical protein